MRCRNMIHGALVFALSGLGVQGAAHAGAMVGVSTSQSDGVSFVLTSTTPPFTVSNPAGSIEHRGAVELDLRSVIQQEAVFEDARFVVRGRIESNKDLTVSAYAGDGTVTAADFLLGSATEIGTQSLVATACVTEISFDLTGYLSGLDGVYPEFLGFNLRESESTGGIVALEYLVLGTVLGLGQVVNFSQTQPGRSVSAPATPLLLGLGLAGLALPSRRRAPRQGDRSA